jgi:hypothetical protein
MKSHNLRLTPNDGKWILAAQDGSPLGNFDTKADGIAKSEALIAGRKGSLKIHRANGALEEELTYPRRKAD